MSESYRIGNTIIMVQRKDERGVIVIVGPEPTFDPELRLDNLRAAFEKVWLPLVFWEAFEKMLGLRTELVGFYEAFFKRYERGDGEDPFWALNRFVDGLWTRVAKLHREWRR